jgi:diguanylate cyclase (GGDEF)-like protein/PAS domain S-box-containing protein
MPALATAAIIVWIVSFYTIAAAILERSVAQIENFQSRKQTERVVNYLSEELNELDKVAAGYSARDATYNFIQTANPSYITSDLASGLELFKVNLIAFIRPSGEIIYGSSYVWEKKERKPINPELLTYLTQNSKLINRSNQGFIALPQRIMLVVARPIGNSQGTLVMGRYLDPKYSQNIAQIIGVNFELRSLKTLETNQVEPYPDINFKSVNQEEFLSYTNLKDINGDRHLILQVKSSRIIYQQTQLSLHYLRISLASLGLVAWGIVLFLITRLSQYLRQRDRIQTILSEKQEALFQEQELAQIALRAIGDGVITTDGMGRINSLNSVAEKLTRWDANEAKDLHLNEVLSIVDEQTEQPVTNLLDTALTGTCAILSPISNYVLINRNQEKFDLDLSIAPICDSNGQVMGSIIVIRDVTQARHHSRELSWQASYDPLTGLINRREFEHRLEQALCSTKAENQEHCLCFLDLDRFKIINDTCGHLAGDELLRQVSLLLKSQVRKTDTVARLGGDEFALLLYQCSVSKAEELAEQICQRVATFRFVWQEKAFNLGVSLGLAVINENTLDFQSVLLAADRACYAAKRSGRGGVVVYSSDTSSIAEKDTQIDWESFLNHALEENRFRLYYQLICCLKSPAESGEFYEVLLRLVDKENNLLLPAAFMASAERYHLMRKIDRWVIEHLFTSQKQQYQEAWQNYQDNGKKCLFSINLSIDTINDSSFIPFLETQVNIHHIPTEIIGFEIAETIAVGNLSQTIEVAQQLKQMGFSFGLDRFGGGISSFGYLKNLPVDFIKIDGRLIAEILEDPVTLAIVESIQRVGELMGIKTMAEFVTNDAITEKIIEVGIDYAQGYGIAEPRPL